MFHHMIWDGFEWTPNVKPKSIDAFKKVASPEMDFMDILSLNRLNFLREGEKER